MIGVLAERDKGAVLRTYLRAVTNVGLAVGMLGAAAVLARLPHLPPTRTADSAPNERRRLALRDRRYLGFTTASSVASLQYWVLVQALPVWIVLRTAAPRSVATLALFVAAVTVAITQIPATRSIDGPRAAARLLVRSGPLFFVAWILMAVASGPSAWATTALLLVAVLVHSLAEVWQAGGTFELSFALAQSEAQGQYQGVIGLGHGFVEAVAPVIVITLCIDVGKVGWVVLGLIVTVIVVAVRWLPALWPVLSNTGSNRCVGYERTIQHSPSSHR